MTTTRENNDPQPPLEPTARGRELVRGAYDVHIHVGPDVMRRRIDDLELARRFKELGLAGFVLKSHYVPTAERASVVREAVPGVDALGSITLNSAVGGLNPLAVEIAAREGARVVWLPTVDGVNETAGREPPRPGQVLPFWAKLQHDLRDKGMGSEPVRVVDDVGQALDATRRVLRVIAAHDLVVCTGHLGRDEIFAVVDAAVEEGVKSIVITHPEFPSQNLSVPDQLALRDRGALLERCFTTPHTGKVSWERMFQAIRECGPAHSLITSDLGQPDNPPVEDGLPLMADRLLGAGFDEDEIRTMIVSNSRRVATGAVEA